MTDEYVPLLRGIAFSGYRSFAHEWQPLLFDSKVTLLAGANNSGKSNVLRYLQAYLHSSMSRSNAWAPAFPNITGDDIPRNFDSTSNPIIGVPLNASDFAEPTPYAKKNGEVHSGSLDDYLALLIYYLQEDGVFWSVFEKSAAGVRPPAARVQEAIDKWPGWRVTYRRILNQVGGTHDPAAVMSDLLARAGGFRAFPPVATIESARQVTPGDASDSDNSHWLSGDGIIRQLQQIQSPYSGSWDASRATWEDINRFVQTILGDDAARINIPHDAAVIQVEKDGRVLPLSNLGSGIEQVIVMAAAATVTKKHLMCIEEPETNLHPILQRKLIRYLIDKTSNQYVIATHSAHILDIPGVKVYHVSQSSLGSQVRLARGPNETVQICRDLGYRPSDLMQTNCIIWVEGPSDRIYLRAWIRVRAPQLVEGIHYSIMFYGGALLSHLSVDEDALRDFISLRRLNRASIVVIDSDKTSQGGRLNDTKRRIRDEFDDSSEIPGFAWVGKCNTIENFIPRTMLQSAVDEVKPGARLRHENKWENPFSGLRIDKIGVARVVAKSMSSQHMEDPDLNAHVTKIVKFIQSAND